MAKKKTDVRAELDEKKEPEKGGGSFFVLVWLAAIILMLGTVSILALNSDPGTPQEEVVLQNVTVYELVPDEVSLSRELGDSSLLNRRVNATGYLLRERITNERDTQTYTEEFYLVDDAGRKLLLSSVSRDERGQFPLAKRSDRLYTVTGKLSKGVQGLHLTLDVLVETEHTGKEVPRVVEQNVTVQRPPGFLERLENLLP